MEDEYLEGSLADLGARLSDSSASWARELAGLLVWMRGEFETIHRRFDGLELSLLRIEQSVGRLDRAITRLGRR